MASFTRFTHTAIAYMTRSQKSAHERLQKTLPRRLIIALKDYGTGFKPNWKEYDRELTDSEREYLCDWMVSSSEKGDSKGNCSRAVKGKTQKVAR